ncbi:MAG: UDP-N-acetylglucosamine 2-epimerase [Candidatus Omnitrophota bacterium]|nr:UDP-N-acetylglucosamine 2-epimerase [Candidatus Omnitrophota bacterium]
MRSKVCIVTGSRAEYGILHPLLSKIKSDRGFQLQLIATGMHLSSEFGLTYKEIEKDGFKINEKVEMLLSSDTEMGIAESIGLGITGFADAFARLKPDLIVLLGDRFEIFAVAIAAFVMRLPIAHIHGGELTEGAMDDAFRHSITKMSYLHFTSTEEYRRRVIQLGESPERVFNVGALSIDNIRSTKLLKREELEKKLNFTFGKRNVLVTFHPVTLENNTAALQFKELLKALDDFKDLKIIFTKPNADTNGRVIIKLIDKYTRDNRNRAVSIVSLGTQMYFSTIKVVDAVVGNSSSGIIEVPAFGRPIVNIGDRQKGRIKAPSIIDCEPQKNAIYKGIVKAFSVDFRQFCKKVRNPYGDGNAAERITKIIKEKIVKIRSLKKAFYNIEFNKDV